MSKKRMVEIDIEIKYIKEQISILEYKILKLKKEKEEIQSKDFYKKLIKK